MKELDMVKDLLQYVAGSEIMYNGNALEIRNPEARQLFLQIRDDEMRTVVKLQQKVERLGAKPKIIAKLLPSKTR